ncbi:MAG: septum site-determining protein MinD [Christensenellales bacterium]
MSRKIVFTSGKGGVGKTTICANLGVKLAQMGQRVVMIDLDIGLNNLDVVMGIENRIVFDIVDCLENKCRVRQALVQDLRYPNLYVLPSSHLFGSNNVHAHSLKLVIDGLAVSFDYVLIDCPAGIDVGFHRAVFCADEAIVVTTPHISAIRDADKVISVLKSYNLVSTKLVVNRIRGDLVLNGEMVEATRIAKLLKTELLGVVADDDDLGSQIAGKVIKNNFKKLSSIDVLGLNLHNGTNHIFDYMAKYRGLFGNIKRNLRRKI